jgi:hypothetical protein
MLIASDQGGAGMGSSGIVLLILNLAATIVNWLKSNKVHDDVKKLSPGGGVGRSGPPHQQ